ncbi:hypothetical protein ACLOAV_001205 [Pseudogymnoascus australis]
MASTDIPSDFHYDEVRYDDEQVTPGKPPAPLGALAYLKGNFHGIGFNTIFRPNSGPPPLGTTFHRPVDPVPPTFPSDSVLQLNLTTDHITFSSNSLGRVPNRGFGSQPDIFLNGISYVQHVKDVTNLKTGLPDKPHPVGIHFETGLFMNIPPTNVNPVLQESLARMASIPHGTTINAQCLSPTVTYPGPPDIPPVSLKPFAEGKPHQKISVPSLNAAKKDTPRLPQDLSKFIDNGTITQEFLHDPNTVLRNDISMLPPIIQTTTFIVSTHPKAPEFGGGVANIAFLKGAPSDTPGTSNPDPNAQVPRMTATFWIETVQSSLQIPVWKPGQPAMKISPKLNGPPQPGLPIPVFHVSPPYEITEPMTITATSTVLQYSQVVFMTFDGITWPHVSVSTLVPLEPVSVPDSAWK